MLIDYFKLRDSAQDPVRANPSDAGLDLRYNPEEDWPTKIDPGQSMILGTGLKFGVPHGYMIQIMNRSGNAAKKQLLVGACVVDSGYDGEVFVNLHNIGLETQSFKSGDKIAQAVLIPISHCGVEEVLEDNLNQKTERGSGGFGSTGDK